MTYFKLNFVTIFFTYFCLEFFIEVPIDSIKAINLTKSKAKSSPIIETGPKVKIDIVKVDSPKRQYNAEVRSSRSEGRYFCYFLKEKKFAMNYFGCLLVDVMKLHFLSYSLNGVGFENMAGTAI